MLNCYVNSKTLLFSLRAVSISVPILFHCVTSESHISQVKEITSCKTMIEHFIYVSQILLKEHCYFISAQIVSLNCVK